MKKRTNPFNVFDFGGITHVIANPVGHSPGWNYSCVGSVPQSLCGRPFATVQEIIEAAKEIEGAKMCASPNCACRKLFTA